MKHELISANEYDAALAQFRIASKAYRMAATMFRNHEITAEEFGQAVKAFKAAQQTMDVAEDKFVQANQ